MLLAAGRAAFEPCGIEHLMELRDLAAVDRPEIDLGEVDLSPAGSVVPTHVDPDRHVRTAGGSVDRLEQRDLPLRVEPVEVLVHAGMTVLEPGERQPIRIAFD